MSANDWQALYRQLEEIRANLHYVLRELPTLKLLPERRDHISNVCTDFLFTVEDLIKEACEVEEQLQMAPSSRRATLLHFLNAAGQQLEEELRQLHDVVLSLKSATDSEPALGLVFVLVAESATNILHAYAAIKERLENLRAAADS